MSRWMGMLGCVLGWLAASGGAGAGDGLEQAFASPPLESRPWVYWYFMDGNLTREGLTADLEAMREGGIGGAIFLEVNVGVPQGPVRFMSREWRELFTHAVREGERLGIRVVLGSGPGWCGTGGPWVPPEQSMQHLVASEIHVEGPRRLEGPLPLPEAREPFFGVQTLTPELKEQWRSFQRDVAVLAFPSAGEGPRIADADEKALYHRAPYSSRPGVKSCLPLPAEPPSPATGAGIARSTILDLSGMLSAEGRLTWDVPAGKWTILRFARTVTGQTTRPAPAPGLGWETDKFDPAAVDAHLERFVGTLLKDAGPRKPGWGGLGTLHFDSWEMSAQNWSARFREEFQRRRGYDPLPFLPAYTGRVVDNAETSERFLWDVRQTAQELVVENHAGRLRDYAHRQGLDFSMEPYDMNPCADLTLGAVADVPMCEFWWMGFDTAYSVIEAASIAHTGGRPVVGAEAFTSMAGEDWQAHPWNIKSLGDWAFAAGVNRIVFHRYQHQPWLDRWPGMRMGPYGVHWERTQTWWPLVSSYHAYLARCQHLLRQGRAVADILYLAPEGAPHVFRPPPSATVGTPPDRREYNFDGCAPETLLARARVEDGEIAFDGGSRYRVLVLPESGAMTPVLLRKIAELVQAGAAVAGAPPRRSPSLSGQPDADAGLLQLTQALWGERKIRWGAAYAKETEPEPAAPSAHPLAGAQWIWSAENLPGLAAPVGHRYFGKTVELPADTGVESATLHATADNACAVFVNGASLGRGSTFQEVFAFDCSRHLRAGANRVEIRGENGGDAPNPAGLIAAVQVRLRSGEILRWTTDQSWTAAGQRDGAGSPARELGPLGMAPWGEPALASKKQLAEPLYPRYEAMAQFLRDSGVPPDFESGGPIRYTHRSLKGAEIYFLANREEQVVETEALFRVAGRQPELWHPVTGERRCLPEWSVRQGRTAVPLRFEALESFFLVFRAAGEPPVRAGANFASLRPVGRLEGPWDLSFESPWGEKARAVFASLEDWSRRPEEEIRFFSGIATYRKSFALPADLPGPGGGRVFLDLGTVRDLARVRLNGRTLGVVWCAPWRVEITGALQPGENRLEIDVANRWINRLIGDAGLPEPQRRTWTTRNPYTRESALVESGLLGPVTLRAE